MYIVIYLGVTMGSATVFITEWWERGEEGGEGGEGEGGGGEGEVGRYSGGEGRPGRREGDLFTKGLFFHLMWNTNVTDDYIAEVDN